MRPISIDSSSKEREFLGLVRWISPKFPSNPTSQVGREGQKYFWTGGNVRGRSINWPSGRSYNNVNWSNTGGGDLQHYLCSSLFAQVQMWTNHYIDLYKDIWHHPLSRARPVFISWFRCYCYCTTAQLAKSVQSAHCAHTQCTAGQGYLSIGTNLTWQQTLPHRDLFFSLSIRRHCWFWWLVIRAGRPQPDNREGDESCLAVLNNFYNDGVRWTLLYLSTGFIRWTFLYLSTGFLNS